jgi:DASS family divalent anion:Na+ symporter
MSRDEIITLLTMSGAVTMWVCGESIGIPPVQAAMMALGTLLLTGVLSWRDCLTYSPAWDTLLWWVACASSLWCCIRCNCRCPSVALLC